MVHSKTSFGSIVYQSRLTVSCSVRFGETTRAMLPVGCRVRFVVAVRGRETQTWCRAITVTHIYTVSYHLWFNISKQ